MLCIYHLNMFNMYVMASVTRKNRQMSVKVAQNVLTRKITDFDTIT